TSIPMTMAAACGNEMDVGTTFTAALATLGGSTASRRTGFAHVVYNILTGITAFLLLEPYVDFVAPWIGSGLRGDPQIALVAFHTVFNTVGVLLILPFTKPFARLITWLIREKGPATFRRLDHRLLSDADAAIDAAMGTLYELTDLVFSFLRSRLSGEVGKASELEELNSGLGTTRAYIDLIRTDPSTHSSPLRHEESLHTLDHLARLTTRLQNADPVRLLDSDDELSGHSQHLLEVLEGMPSSIDQVGEENLEALLLALRERHHKFRERTIERAARSESSGKAALARLDSFRWLLRTTDHAWRIVHHLRRVGSQPITH
ncbi:MAG: Na/Pi cotransporter family protein, partial [Acidobacteriota bacterium]